MVEKMKHENMEDVDLEIAGVYAATDDNRCIVSIIRNEYECDNDGYVSYANAEYE